MLTNFILCHIDNEPIIINIQDISYISENHIFLRSRHNEESCIVVDESFEIISYELCKVINNG